MKTVSMLEAALEYVRAGLPVVPLHGVRKDGSCTCNNPACRSIGKHPRNKGGVSKPATTEAQVKQWWGSTHWPNASIGGVGGRFLCLDVDVKNGGDVELEKLISDTAQFPHTAIAETGEYVVDGVTKRGRHYWFKLPEGKTYGNYIGLRPGIDVRCHGGYAVLPPSAHASGVNYEWVVPFSEVSEPAAWFEEVLPEAVEADAVVSWTPPENFHVSRQVREFITGEYHVPPGEQRGFLTTAARSILATKATVEETAELLWEGKDGAGGICSCDWEDTPWTYEEIRYIVEDIFRKPPSSKWVDKKDQDRLENYRWDEMGNGDRIAALFDGGQLRYVEDWDKWYVWSKEDKTWIEDSGKKVVQAWKRYTTEALVAADTEYNEKYKKWMQRSSTRSQTENALYFLKAKEDICIHQDQLNVDPLLLNCKNGVLNLKTGELLPQDPSLLLTKQIRAEYVKGAQSDLWDDFITNLIPDEKLRKFVQKIFGYTLTGETVEHKLFYFHGPPGAGKTTLLEAFSYLMGNYSESSDPVTFMQTRQDGGPSEDLARLANARMVVTHEVEESSRWAMAKVSRLTGGDQIQARFLHKNSFTFYPKFKLFFSANHKPRAGSADSGLWRRLIIVPIDRVIPKEDRDPIIPRRLRQREHLSAMLSWALEGCLEWMKDYEAGRLMKVPEIVEQEVEAYKTEENHLLQFASEMLVTTKTDKDRIPKQDLYQIYQGWCETEGRRQRDTQHKLTSQLKALGFESKHARFNGKPQDCWVKLRIKGLPSIKGS